VKLGSFSFLSSLLLAVGFISVVVVIAVVISQWKTLQPGQGTVIGGLVGP
jgi:hypothetical protein